MQPSIRTRSLLALAMLLLAGCAGGRSDETTPASHASADLLLPLAEILRAEDRREVDAALLRARSHRAEAVRARAALALGRIGGAEQRARLEEALHDPSSLVRARAALGLGLLGDAAGVPALVAAASDAAPEVRAAVADALGRLAHADGSTALAGLLADPDPQVTAAACVGLPRFARPEFAIDRLLELSSAEKPELVLLSVDALSQLAARPGALLGEPLRRARGRMIELTTATSPELRRLAAAGLNLPTRDAEAAAVGRLVEDAAPEVRIAAIGALSFPGAPLDPFLRKVLADPDDRVMLAVVKGLGRMRGDDVLEELARIVASPTRPMWLRVAAVESLASSSKLSAPMANGLSREPEPRLRAASASLLIGRIDAQTQAFARRLLEDRDPEVRAAILPAFAEMSGLLAEPLSAALADPDPDIRIGVAVAAGRRLSGEVGRSDAFVADALAMLKQLWETSGADPRIELAVVEALERAPAHAAARELLRLALGSAERRVRLRAIRVLRATYSEDRADAAGPAADRPLEDYRQILRWAERPRAAIVTVERPGFTPGRFTIRLDVAEAPLSAWSFAQLAAAGAYDGLAWTRLVPNVEIRTADPAAGFPIREERHAGAFWPGAVGLATIADDESHGGWFVAQRALPHREFEATAFGRVVRNFAGVAALILPDDRIVGVQVYEGDGTEALPPLPPEPGVSAGAPAAPAPPAP